MYQSILFAIISLAIQPLACLAFDPPTKIRNMTASDIPAATDTVLSAFDPGRMFSYLYQFKDQLPKYHRRCYQAEIEREFFVKHRMDYYHVIVPPEEENHRVRSFGGWTMMSRNESDVEMHGGLGLWSFLGLDALAGIGDHDEAQTKLSDGELKGKSMPQIQQALNNPDEDQLPCQLHLDVNFTRAFHLVPQLEAAEKNFITDAYEHQLYLAVLATHPDWDGHGFGAAQVTWGLKMAVAEEQRLSQIEGKKVTVPVTLMATPAGHPLYAMLGFKSVANITFDLLDDEPNSTTWYEYMRWISDEQVDEK